MSQEAGQGSGGPRARSRFYAVSVVAGMEARAALVLEERARTLGLDIRSIVVPVNVKGYIVIEAGDIGDVAEAVRGVRYIKRRRPILMKPEEVLKLARPTIEVPTVKEGQVVEIVAGPLKGMRGKVVEVRPDRNEVSIVLLESTFRSTVTLPLEEVRVVEEE